MCGFCFFKTLIKVAPITSLTFVVERTKISYGVSLETDFIFAYSGGAGILFVPTVQTVGI